MLIAAYAGCGKSTAAEKLGPSILDLPSMPYRWLLPCRDLTPCTRREIEREKGALHRVADPRFPQNYVLAILKAEREGKTVIFPTIVSVIDMLVDRYEREVFVVYPEDDLKEEYRRRYQKRGNSETFLSLFVDDWERQLESIGESGGCHLRLKSGEYLLSVLEHIPGGFRPCSSPVSDAALAELEQEVEESGKHMALWTQGPQGRYVLRMSDIDSPETREFLDTLGKTSYNRGLYPLRLSPESFVKYAPAGALGVTEWLDSRDEFSRIIETMPAF